MIECQRMCLTGTPERRDGMTAAERLVDLLRMGSGLGAVVHDPSNMFYLTEGYTGEGLVYISAQRRVIITDFR